MPRLPALLALAAALSSGCASLQYQVPKDSPRARLTIVNAVGPGKVSVTTHRKTDCTDVGKAVPHRGDEVLPGASDTFDIEAGAPFTFAVQTLRPLADGRDVDLRYAVVNTCHTAATFTPEPGRLYRARFVDTKSSCGVEVLEGERELRVPSFAPKTWIYPTLTEGHRCAAVGS